MRKARKEMTKMETFSNLIDLDSYSPDEWNMIVELAQQIQKNPALYRSRCSGKIMGTLFYEPSTRTQMSFQTAMLRLGGTIIGFDNPSTSSVSKGENIKDTTKIVSSYADILVMRNPYEGSAKAAALTADRPVINAGDGGHLHPTQTLTDTEHRKRNFPTCSKPQPGSYPKRSTKSSCFVRFPDTKEGKSRKCCKCRSER